MTPPTFQELLTSQEARDKIPSKWVKAGEGDFYLTALGSLMKVSPKEHEFITHCIWQGWLTDCAPPPEPRVFKRVMYFNVYENNVGLTSFHSRKDADYHNNHARDRLACVRVEITAIEGVFDD